MVFSAFLVQMTAMIVALFVVTGVVAFLAGRKDHVESDWQARRAAGSRDAAIRRREERLKRSDRDVDGERALL